MRMHVQRFIPLLILIISAAVLPARPVVVFLSDFGLENEAVGLCHGAMLTVDSDLQIVDLTHEVPPFNIRLAGDILARATTFPKGTVFVSVVDPGVGTDRTAIAVRTGRGYCFIAPNNGLLTAVLEDQEAVAACRIDPKRINPDWHPGTFDGRDLFTPAAARLAVNGGDLAALGTPLEPEKIVRLKNPRASLNAERGEIEGHYLRTDQPYGNVWTDIPAGMLEKIDVHIGDAVKVRIGDTERTVPFQRTFGDVDKGLPLAYINSDGRLALAVNMGNLREAWKLEEGQPVTIRKAGRP